MFSKVFLRHGWTEEEGEEDDRQVEREMKCGRGGGHRAGVGRRASQEAR